MAKGESGVVRVNVPACVTLAGELRSESGLPTLLLPLDVGLLVEARAAEGGVVVAERADMAGQARLRRSDGSVSGPGWGRSLSTVATAMTDAPPGLGASIRYTPPKMTAGASLVPDVVYALGAIAALNELWECGLDRAELVRRAADDAGADSVLATAMAFAPGGEAVRVEAGLPPEGVPLPPGAAFVVARTEDPEDSKTLKAAEREVIVGARLAAALIADMVGIDPGQPPRLVDIAHLPEAGLLVEELPERAAPAAVARSTGLLAPVLTAVPGGSLSEREQVPVRRPATALLDLAEAVDVAVRALSSGDLKALGAVLNASQTGLNRLSLAGPGADSLCEAMRSAGAHGARSCGAGVVMAVTDVEQVDAVIAASEESRAFRVRAGGPVVVERA